MHFNKCHCITDTIYIYRKKLLNVKHHLMEAKSIELSTLLQAGFKKTKISKQLNISRITVHWVKQRLKASEFLKNHPGSGVPKVISKKAIKKGLRKRPMLENDKSDTEE